MAALSRDHKRRIIFIRFFLVFCSGFEVITKGISSTSNSIGIEFNHVPGVDDSPDLMGYKVLYKQTDNDEWWQEIDKRGGWYRHHTISNLAPYTNYSIRVAPYSFKAGGLAGPMQVNATAEGGEGTILDIIRVKIMW